MNSFLTSSDWIEEPGCDRAAGGPCRSVEDRPNGPAKPMHGRKQEGDAVGWGLLWLIGIPIPILLTLFVLRGCT
jgi:hypothetical protein